uniref:Uncharacterized protein n=1 Tax=Globodera rostochiensis TaxID=31243 RepID=A0A914IB38_GLORO
MILLTSFWLISQAFLSDCSSPTDPFILKGTVVPAGNYHIYVRTVSSAYLSAILRSYDKEIGEVKATVNNARMWHSDLPNLVNQRFDAETSFALLGQSEIVNGSKFEIHLDWPKGHNAYFDRKKHPIYVQIYTKNKPTETSLMERILIDPSPVKIHKDNNPLANPINDLLANTDADGNFVLKFGSNIQLPENCYLSFYDPVRLGNSPNVKPKIFTAQLEYDIKYFRTVEIDFLNNFCSTESSERPFHNVVYGEMIIRNLPEFEGRQVTKIEVKSSSIGIYEKQPFIIEAQKGTDKSKNIFITNTYQDLRFPLTVTPIEFEPAEKYPLFQHKLTYPTLASTSICYENMKALIQFEESDGEKAPCWRYNFEQGLENDGIGMGEEKAKMIDLYKTYLKERSDITNAEHIQDIRSNAEDIRVNIDAYALSLQMVDMKKIGNN